MNLDDVWTRDQLDELSAAIHPRWARKVTVLRLIYELSVETVRRRQKPIPVMIDRQDLAEFLGVGRQQATEILKQMADAGMLNRIGPDPAGRRVQAYSIEWRWGQWTGHIAKVGGDGVPWNVTRETLRFRLKDPLVSHIETTRNGVVSHREANAKATLQALVSHVEATRDLESEESLSPMDATQSNRAESSTPICRDKSVSSFLHNENEPLESHEEGTKEWEIDQGWWGQKGPLPAHPGLAMVNKALSEANGRREKHGMKPHGTSVVYGSPTIPILWRVTEQTYAVALSALYSASLQLHPSAIVAVIASAIDEWERKIAAPPPEPPRTIVLAPEEPQPKASEPPPGAREGLDGAKAALSRTAVLAAN